MSLDLMTFEQDLSPNGQRHVWLEPNVANRLRAMRGPGESYSDVPCGWPLRSPKGRPLGGLGGRDRGPQGGSVAGSSAGSTTRR